MKLGHRPTANSVTQKNGKRLLAIYILFLFRSQKAFKIYWVSAKPGDQAEKL